ncbi:hypothetical protein BKA64DRAFT_639744 [Cadophora sp. MPI-SDFR-AT-0126]|nr:hypothetical protein BKA64DRAFT_639744 [Leotiomycetes sp. MPI-SDFR-AT-0126]
MSENAPNSDIPKDSVPKAAIQTSTSTQRTNASLPTVPRRSSPEVDSLMARFLTDAISNLKSHAPLPPNTPTGPKAMSQPLKDSSATSKSTSATPAVPKNKTRSPSRRASQNQELEYKSLQKSGLVTPDAKRHTSWSRLAQETPCPDGSRKRSCVTWDHWSPETKRRRDLFDDRPKRYRDVESATWSRKDGDRSLQREYIDKKGDSTGQVRKEEEPRPENRTQGKHEARNGMKKEDLPLLRPKAVEPSPRRKKYPSLLSLAVPGHKMKPVDKSPICYNCAKKGHLFVNCLVKCGHCGGDGHKTMCCETIYLKSDSANKKG